MTDKAQQERFLEAQEDSPPDYNCLQLQEDRKPVYVQGQDGVVYQQPMAGYQPAPCYQQPQGTYYNQGPGQVMVYTHPKMENPPSHFMVYSILVTICCCWPIGIFAILRASSCKEAIARGDREGASRLSREAKRLANWALGVGGVCTLVSVGLLVVYMMVVTPYVFS